MNEPIPGVVPGRPGWSKMGAERLGRRWSAERNNTTGPCYYCGVVGCQECGDVPALLRDWGSSDDEYDEEA